MCPSISLLAFKSLIVTITLLALAGCGDPYYSEYITNPGYRTTGTFALSEAPKGTSVPIDSQIVITDDTVTVSNFPNYSFSGKLENVVKSASFSNRVCIVGSRSDGKMTYGFQGKSISGDVNFDFISGDRISICIGDPDSGDRIVYLKR